MSTPLGRIEEREIQTGPRFLTLWEQTALLNVAKAAEDVCPADGVFRISKVPALREALAVLDKALAALHKDQPA